MRAVFVLFYTTVSVLAVSVFSGSNVAHAAPRCEDLFISRDVVKANHERGPRDLAYHLEAQDARAAYDRVLKKYVRVVQSDLTLGGERQPLLSIVIPAYREEARIPRSIEIIRAFMNRYKLPYEVVIVAERSPDRTFEVATEAARGDDRIVVVQNRDGFGQPVQGGKGFAVRTGMFRTSGRYRLFMDADFSTSMVEILRFLDVMMPEPGQVGPQMLIGSRAEHAGEVGQHRTLMRETMSSTMRQVTAFLGRPREILDTQCGFKMFTEHAANFLFPIQRENGFAFDVELVLLATKFDFDLRSQEVEWIDAPGSTVNPIRDSLKMLRAMMRIRSDTNHILDVIRRNPPVPGANQMQGQIPAYGPFSNQQMN